MFSRLLQKNKGAFWSDNNQLNLHNWAAKTFDLTRQHCAYINGTDGKWYLTECDTFKQYVCKVSSGTNRLFIQAVII